VAQGQEEGALNRRARCGSDRPRPARRHHRPDAARSQAKTFAVYLAPIVAKDAGWSATVHAYGAFAHAENIRHVPIIVSPWRARLRGSTSRTSTATPAASRAGCAHSTASAANICRVISLGAALSSAHGERFTPERCAFQAASHVDQHEGRTEPRRQSWRLCIGDLGKVLRWDHIAAGLTLLQLQLYGSDIGMTNINKIDLNLLVVARCSARMSAERHASGPRDWATRRPTISGILHPRVPPPRKAAKHPTKPLNPRPVRSVETRLQRFLCLSSNGLGKSPIFGAGTEAKLRWWCGI